MYNKGADQTTYMPMLVCASVINIQQNQIFSQWGQYEPVYDKANNLSASSDDSWVAWTLAQSDQSPCLMHTVKPVLSDHSKRDQKLAFKIKCCLMQVKSIAECSKRAFCNTFDLH